MSGKNDATMDAEFAKAVRRAGAIMGVSLLGSVVLAVCIAILAVAIRVAIVIIW